METLAIIIIAIVGLYCIGEAIYYRKRLYECETAYKDLCKKYNVYKNAN